jgi:hypothetical protein
MKVRVPLLIKDKMATDFIGVKRTEGFEITDEPFFLDGPVTRRVAVLDLDAETGALHPGARFRPPGVGPKIGGYDLADDKDLEARDFNQVSVFGTVLKTMKMFEEADTLGRKLTWAFDAPQLLVVPRAGEWANAFYERDSHSLQFFYFPDPGKPQSTIFTSQSQDIVAHETGHAILDGIAPDLYNATTPQSLALHEAVADLTALLIAFHSDNLRKAVLKQTEGSIDRSQAFSGIAAQFGEALSGGGSNYLRELHAFKTLEPGHPDAVAGDEPHELSVVLSGALYSVMTKIFDRVKAEISEEDHIEPLSASGKSLFIAANRFKRIIYRGLDYLPPGDVSFADYGLAMIAADQASHPDDEQEREWIREEFVRRHIVPDAKTLRIETNVAHPALRDLDLETVLESNWAAYEFANRNRKLLEIPPGIPFEVRPRLDVTKLYYHKEGKREVRELLFKVSWDETEPNPSDSVFPPQRQFKVGTTLAIDWDQRLLRAKLPSRFGRKQRKDRTALLRRLVDDDLLQFDRHAFGPDGNPLRSGIQVQTIDGLMRVRGAARMLHIARGF